MRYMSFSMTTEAVRRREKTATRRDGWRDLKPGTLLQPVEKAQGLKRGEHVTKIGGPIRILGTRWEPLSALILNEHYGAQEMVREGFPDMLPADFCLMYIEHNGGDIDTPRNRIAFEYVDEVTP